MYYKVVNNYHDYELLFVRKFLKRLQEIWGMYRIVEGLHKPQQLQRGRNSDCWGPKCRSNCRRISTCTPRELEENVFVLNSIDY